MALNDPALLADLTVGVLLICAAAIKAHKQKRITIHNRFNLRNTTITKAGRQTQSSD